MEEINYSENVRMMRYVMFKPFTQETIGNDGIWKEDGDFKCILFEDKIVGDKKTCPSLVQGQFQWVYMV